MNHLLKNSKKGVTLVEAVLALVILALIAAAVFSLFTAGNGTIATNSAKAAAYAEAVQKMDYLIAAISDNAAICSDPITGELSVVQVKTAFPDGDLYDAEITAEVSLYDPSLPQQPGNIRGWYLTLTYKGVTLKGFTSLVKGGIES